MRVIAGTYRSRVLRAPRGTSTRPTSDRLRETLFNVLAARIVGARFADLYAGSGAIGIEAVSRGAAQVYFAETSRAALECIHANLRALQVPAMWTVEGGGTGALLKRLTVGHSPLDVVFLDPPYDDAMEYSRTLTALGHSPLLHTDGLVVAEHTRKQDLQDGYGRLHRTRTMLQGDAALSFYVLRESTDASDPVTR